MKSNTSWKFLLFLLFFCAASTRLWLCQATLGSAGSRGWGFTCDSGDCHPSTSSQRCSCLPGERNHPGWEHHQNCQIQWNQEKVWAGSGAFPEGFRRICAAGCCEVWHQCSVCGRWLLSMMYPWHNAGLCWISLKIWETTKWSLTEGVRWLLCPCWSCTRDEAKLNVRPAAWTLVIPQGTKWHVLSHRKLLSLQNWTQCLH